MQPYALAFMLLLGACASASAPQGEAGDASSSALPSLNIQVAERVARGVHVLRQPGDAFAGVIGNVTIIEQSDGLVLVDSGSSHGAGLRVVEHIKAISSLPVKAVIITHWHNDHPLGLSAIIAEWPDADIISTQRASEEMEAGRLGAIQRAPSAEYEAARVTSFEQALASVEANTTDETITTRERAEWVRVVSDMRARMPDVVGTYYVPARTTFTERHVIADARAPVEAIFLGRANTDGDAVVWLPRQRILIAGDIVVEPIPFLFNMYPSDQIAALERLKTYDFQALVPGHGSVQRDRAYLDRVIGLIRETQAQVGPLARQGLSLEEVNARVDFSAQQALFAGDDPWRGYWFPQYATTPLVESVYREARGEPLGPGPLP